VWLLLTSSIRKRLVSANANYWSVAMQLGGQVGAISHTVREYVLGAVIVPSIMRFVWFALVVGTAI
jgi:choline-glycine betaine transporter